MPRLIDLVPWKISKDRIKSMDIFSTGLRFTGETVFVVGSGPNGKSHWHKIEKDNFVFVVNQAATIDDIPKSIWLCEDVTLMKSDLFNRITPEIVNKSYTIDELKNPDIMVPVFCRGIWNAIFPKINFTFEHGGMLRGRARRKRITRKYIKVIGGKRQIRPVNALQKKNPKPLCVWGTTFGGATISSRAVQIATLLGADKIILCGIDMKGNSLFFDYNRPKDKVWGQCARFNHLIQWVHENTKTRIYSLSQTALGVPMI